MGSAWAWLGLARLGWAGETRAIREFGGDFHPGEQRELSVGFGGE